MTIKKNRLTDKENQQVAKTILKQMGGLARLNVMIGVKDVCVLNLEKFPGGGVEFKWKAASKRGCGKCVQITVNGLDLYDMKFIQLPRIDLSKIKSVDDIPMPKVTAEYTGLYEDMLIPSFEDHTELYLHF